MTATKTSDNKYNYSTISVVLLTEIIKLFISIGIYAKDKSLTELIPEILSGHKVLFLYMVPAFLYCLYNNLAFVNLASYDPTTYYMLLQLRVAVTGIIYQLLFKRTLSRSQWLSLILLTLGCVIKQLGGFSSNSSDDNYTLFRFNIVLILMQVFCSCFAGVYNEYLLKDVGSEVHIMVQNVFMYIDSIACNLLLLVITGEFSRLTELSQSITIISDPKIIAVMVNNALCGIITSFFLKNLNSILKTFASALELIFTAILCLLIFNIPIDVYTVFGIAIVSYSTFLYSKNPVITSNDKPLNEDNQRNDIHYSLIEKDKSDGIHNV